MPSTIVTKVFQDALDSYYGVLLEEIGVSNYPLNLAIDYCNFAQNAICDGSLTDFAFPKPNKVSKPFLSFLSSRTFFSTVNPGTIATVPAVGDTVLNLGNAADYLSSGTVWVGGALITYTGKTATALTGCSGVIFPFQAGSLVFQVFPLPADFGTPTRLILDGTTTVRSVDQRDITRELYGDAWFVAQRQASYQGLPAAVNSEPKYSVIDGKYVLLFPMFVSGRQLNFEYQRSAVQYSSLSTALTIPDAYSLRCISLIAASEMLSQRAEMDEANKLRAAGLAAVKQMYDAFAYGNRENAFGQRVRSATDDRVLNV